MPILRKGSWNYTTNDLLPRVQNSFWPLYQIVFFFIGNITNTDNKGHSYHIHPTENMVGEIHNFSEWQIPACRVLEMDTVSTLLLLLFHSFPGKAECVDGRIADPGWWLTGVGSDLSEKNVIGFDLSKKMESDSTSLKKWIRILSKNWNRIRSLEKNTFSPWKIVYANRIFPPNICPYKKYMIDLYITSNLFHSPSYYKE